MYGGDFVAEDALEVWEVSMIFLLFRGTKLSFEH